MTADELRQLHQARPFEPFTLELADGQKVSVPHPEFLSFSKRGRTIAVATGENAFKLIDVYLITSVQVGDRRAAGRRRKR